MGTGKIIQVIGTVVDVEFQPNEMPAIFNALETKIGNDKLVGRNYMGVLRRVGR